MSARITHNNATVRIMDKASQRWAPLSGTDDSGNGTLVAIGQRAMVSGAIADLYDCFIARGGQRGFAAIGHGVRLTLDSVSGQGAACFVERKGASVGEVYVFGGLAKKVAILARLGEAVAGCRDESKGGLYITLVQGANCNAVLDVLEAPEFRSTSSANGYRSDMGASTLTLGDGIPQADSVQVLAGVAKTKIIKRAKQATA